MFGGFPERAQQPEPLPVDWEAQEKRSKYNDTQAAELGHITDSTETEPDGSVIGKHDQDADLLNKENGFSHAQAISGRAGEIVTARLSRRTKIVIGAIATIPIGFGVGFVGGYLYNHEGTSTNITELCTEQPDGSNPNVAAVLIGNCDPNQNLGR